MRTKLSEISSYGAEHLDKRAVKEETEKLVKELGDLQNMLYAEGKHSVLIILQGMDASGKDGTVRKVFSRVNPAGCGVYSFKKPTAEEMGHDFLWRIHKYTPRKGMIQVFNRSHYEDVLIQRVHKWINKDRVQERFMHINAFERLLEQSGTKVLKFFLYMSPHIQLERLNERMITPHKHWKHNKADFEERKHWDKYMAAYEDVLNQCNSIPWTIVPCDRKWIKENIVVQKVVETLRGLDMQYPQLEL